MVFKPIKLSDKQTKALTDLTENIEAIKFEIARAKRAGLDVKELQARFEEGVKLREGILREYS